MARQKTESLIRPALRRAKGRLLLAIAAAQFHSADIHVSEPLIAIPGGRIKPGRLPMSEKQISRRGVCSLLGLAAAFGVGVPTTMLTSSDAEAQAQPTAPAPSGPAPSTSTPSASTPSGSTSGKSRRQARHAGRHQRREARRHAREMRREARRGNNKSMYMKSNVPKQQ